MFASAACTKRTAVRGCREHCREAHEGYKRSDRLLRDIWKETQDNDGAGVCFANSASAPQPGTWEWVEPA